MTTDVSNSCTDRFDGTSASVPLAAGAIALLLEAKCVLACAITLIIESLKSDEVNELYEGWRIHAISLQIPPTSRAKSLHQISAIIFLDISSIRGRASFILPCIVHDNNSLTFFCDQNLTATSENSEVSCREGLLA